MESQYHGLSRKKIAELRRKAEKKEKNRAYYEKNREKLIEKTKEKRRQSRESDSRPQTRGSFTIKKAQKGSKAKEIREKRRTYLFIMVKKKSMILLKPVNLCN